MRELSETARKLRETRQMHLADYKERRRLSQERRDRLAAKAASHQASRTIADAVSADSTNSRGPSLPSTATQLSRKSTDTMAASSNQSTSHPHLKGKAATSDEGAQEAKKTKLDKGPLASGVDTPSNAVFKANNPTPEEKKQSRAQVTERATKGWHTKPEFQPRQPVVSTQKPAFSGARQGQVVAPKSALGLQDGVPCTIAQPVVRKQLVRADSPDTSKKSGPPQRAGVAPPKGTTPVVPPRQAMASKAVPAIKKTNILWNKPQPVVRKQTVRAEEEPLRQAPKRKMDAIEDATKARIDPPKAKTPGLPQGQAVALKAVPPIKTSIIWNKTQPAVRKQPVRAEEEHLRPARKRKMDDIEDACDDRPAKWSMAANGQKQTSTPQVKTAINHADDSLSSSSSSAAELEMPPTPGRAPESDDDDTVEHDSATQKANATHCEAEDTPKSSEELTNGSDSLFVGSSSPLDAFDEATRELDALFDKESNNSSPASSPDSGKGEKVTPGPHSDCGGGHEGVLPRGMINHQNSCFAASVLQALSSIGPFTKFYKMFTDDNMIHLLKMLKSYMQNLNGWKAMNPYDLALKKSKLDKIRGTLRDHFKAKMRFRTAMGEVLRQISMPPSDKHDPFDPAAFLQVVGCLTECVDENGKIVPVFNGDEVADASEFLTALFDLLIIEEIRKSKSGDQISTKVGELFGGTTTQILECSNCKRTSKSEIAVRCPLTTSMPKDIQDPTLEDCLDKLFQQKAYMEGFECQYCEVEAVKQTTFGKQVPKYLAVQVNRMISDQEGEQWKRNDDLRIDPSKTIDMSRWWRGCKSVIAYEVCAIVEHEGEHPYDGHYWALRKDEEGRWHKFDDDEVTKISAKTIPTEHCKGCLVFLRKAE